MEANKKHLRIYTLLCLIILPILYTQVFAKNSDKIVYISTLHQADEVKDIYEIVAEAYNNIGYQVKIYKMPAKRSLIEVRKANGIDGELARVKAAEKLLPDHIRIPVVIKTMSSYLYGYKKSYNFKGWRDLKPYKVAIIRGVIANTQALEYNKIDYLEVNTAIQAFELLKKERVDIVVMPEVLAISIVNSREFIDINRSINPIDKQPLFHFIHKNYQHIVPKLTKSLRKVIQVN
jgi:polar amino acid transport system substrate-binding protein